MKIILPSHLTFWRSVFALTGVLAFLAINQILGSATKLGVDLSVSTSWQGLIAGLTLMGLLSLFLLAITWSRHREQALSLAESPERLANGRSWMAIVLVAAALAGFSILFMIPSIQ